MTNTDNFLMVSKNWLVDEKDKKDSNLLCKYGELGFGFYIYCIMSQQAYDASSKVCISEFLDMFSFTNKRTRKNKKQELLSTIESMQENGLITFYSDFALSEVIKFDANAKDTQILYCNVDKLEGSFFVKLSKLEIFTIISAKSNQLNLLIHYIAIMCYENLNDGYCFPSIEALANTAQTSKNTVLRYNDMLCELGVLYYGNAGMKYMEADNSYQSFSNTYSRYVNKDKVDDFIIKTIAKEKGKVTNTTKNKQKRTNKSRSLKGKINYLDAKENLTVEEVEELELLRVEHAELRKQIEKQQNESYSNLIPKDDVKEEVEIQEEVEVIDIKPIIEPDILDSIISDVIEDVENEETLATVIDITDKIAKVEVEETEQTDYGWLDELEEEDYKPKTVVKTKAEINKEMADKWAVSPEWQEVFGEEDEDWAELFG